MFISIHKYMYKMYNVKVLGNPFDYSWEVTFDIPHEWPPKTGLTVYTSLQVSVSDITLECLQIPVST